MLGDKDRVPAHRGLPAVIHGLGRCQPPDDEIARVIQDHRHTAQPEIGEFLVAEPKTSPERRPAKAVEDTVEIAHGVLIWGLIANHEQR